VLLSDTRIQKLLAERTVPVWQSVGPVPTVTVDFGHGKTLKRTLGGNTVLLLILPDGRALDAFPGVYTPDDFSRELDAFFAVLDESGGIQGIAKNSESLRVYHQLRTRSTSDSREIVRSKVFAEAPILPRPAVPASDLRGKRVNPALVIREGENPFRKAFEESAARLVDVSKIPASAAAVRSAYDNDGATPEARGMDAVRSDSASSVQVIRPVVHLYFAAQDANVLPTAEDCRKAMYEKVLHTPLNDPYLGLADVLIPGTPGGSE
jgi:hypothetical protein